ncbi:heat-shock protein HtpX, partial [Actinoplanes sp. NPDC026670]
QNPARLTWEAAEATEVIVTMGCGDACPVFPGKRYEDWKLTDPAGQPLDVVRQIRDDIKTRVTDLLATIESQG